MLLSAGKKASSSSQEINKGPEKATEENVRGWWRGSSSNPGQWLKIDLGKAMDINIAIYYELLFNFSSYRHI